jgi:hypothetical protein
VRRLLLLVVTGCLAPTPIGPYVKTVARDGGFLMVQKCTIILEGDDLREDQCGWERVPLATIGPPVR